MNRIAKNYIYNTLYQLIAMVTPLLTAPYLSRVLGADGLGIYGYVSSITSIFATIGLLGLYTYGNRSVAYYRDIPLKLSRFFWEIMSLRGLLLVLITFIFLIHSINNDYKVYFAIYYPWLLASFLDVSWFYVGLENMGPAAIKNTIAKVVTALGIFLFVNTENDLIIYLMIISISTLISNLILFPGLKQYISKPTLDLNYQNIKKHLVESLYLFLPYISSVLYTQIDKIMIQKIANNVAEVGYYVQAEKIINVPLALVTGLSTVMMPRIANEFQKKQKKNINNLVIKAIIFSVSLAIPMSIGIAIISPQFITWFLGEDFSSSSVIVTILSPMIILNSLTSISSQMYFLATNQMGYINKINFIALALNVILNLILIPNFESTGAAASTVIATLFSVVAQYSILGQQMNLKEVKNNFLKYTLYSLVMGLIIIVIEKSISFGDYIFVIQIITGILVYWCLLFITKDRTYNMIISIITNKFK